jgi:signal transduction histidine kinase
MPEDFAKLKSLPVMLTPVNRAVLEERVPYGVSDVAMSLERMSEEMRADPDISLWARSVSDNFQAYLSVPLVVKDEIYGGISFFYTDHQEFAEESVNLAVALSDQVALAIENARLREQAEEAAVVAERNRLARDLHDAVSQTLFSASIIAEVLPRIWERNPEEGNRRLDELRQLTRGALAEMRMLLVELRPAALLETELGDLLHHLTEAFTGKTRVPVRLQVNGSCTLPPDTQVAFYRVAQEALNNIAKHANASQVWVTLDCEVPTVNLMIRDDGRGFDPARIPSDHFGVQIMHERAASIGATLTLTSAPNEGTEVVIRWSP